MKNVIKILLGVLMLSVFLTACGSIESKIVGNWKVVIEDDGDARGYLEIGENRIISREESDDEPITLEYILTETQDDTFILEVVNPEDGTNEFFFEGYFENKNTINIVDAPGDSEGGYGGLVRIESVREAMKTDEEKELEEQLAKDEEEKKRAAKDAEIQDEEKEQENVAQDETEAVEMNDDEVERINAASEYIMELIEKGRLGEAKGRLSILGESITSQGYTSSLRAMDDMIESAKYEREQERKSPNYSSLKEEYAHKARIINEDIEQKYKGDVGIGFYGDYFDDWDGLLNEVWGVLADTMPKDKFEQLKQEQVKWVQEKDANYEEARGEVDAKDRLTNTTRKRTSYLIDNILDE